MAVIEVVELWSENDQAKRNRRVCQNPGGTDKFDDQRNVAIFDRRLSKTGLAPWKFIGQRLQRVAQGGLCLAKRRRNGRTLLRHPAVYGLI